MSVATLSLVGVVALGFFFDYTNGFHDAANSVSTVVATRVLRPRWAVLWAAGWNFVAFLVVGTAVANTVGQTVKPGSVGIAVVFSALLGAVAWNLLSWHLGLPTSSSHALIGGLVGAGVARGGWAAIKTASITKTAVFIVISPVAGFLLAGLVMLVLRFALRNVRDVPATEKRFRKLQLLSSAAVSLGHGGNDAQKTMGAIAALLAATGHLTVHGSSSNLPIPLWVVLLAYAAIALGTVSGGWRIVKTVGMDITQLRPVSGFAAETAAAVALFASTGAGAPVSTTHTVAGSVTGAGAANRPAPVHWRILPRLVLAWVVTLPFAALCAALAYAVTTDPPPAVAGVILGVVILLVAGSVVRSLKTAPKASEIESDLGGADDERPVPMRPGTGSVISAGAPYPDSFERSEPRLKDQRVAL